MSVNMMLSELLRPFAEVLNTIYRSTYVKRETCLQLLANFDSFLQVFSQQHDKRTYAYTIMFVDELFAEVKSVCSKPSKLK